MTTTSECIAREASALTKTVGALITKPAGVKIITVAPTLKVIEAGVIIIDEGAPAAPAIPPTLKGEPHDKVTNGKPAKFN